MGDSNAQVPVSIGGHTAPNNAVDSRALIALHRQFLQHLTALDQAGEHVAAAHLVAAIDALERRLGLQGEVARNQEMRLNLFVTGLLDRLGDRALDVARRQMNEASGSALTAWTAITDRIAAKRS